MVNKSTSDPAGGQGGDTSTIVTEQVKQGAQNASQQAQETAGKLATQAKQQTSTALQGQKDKAMQTLQQVSSALRQTGQNLDQQQNPVGQYLSRAADQVDTASGYLQGRNVEDLVGEAQAFAQRSPAVFLGGAFALGMLAARFLKSSSSGQSSGTSAGYSASSSGYGSGTYEYGSVQYGTDTIGGTPTVDRDYAPGLMGAEADARVDNGA